MPDRFFFTAKIVFYEDVSRYGFRIYARALENPSLLLVSPGKYENCDEAIRASEAEIISLKSRLLSYGLRKGVVYTQKKTGGAA